MRCRIKWCTIALNIRSLQKNQRFTNERPKCLRAKSKKCRSCEKNWIIKPVWQTQNRTTLRLNQKLTTLQPQGSMCRTCSQSTAAQLSTNSAWGGYNNETRRPRSSLYWSTIKKLLSAASSRQLKRAGRAKEARDRWVEVVLVSDNSRSKCLFRETSTTITIWSQLSSRPTKRITTET